MLQIVNVSPLLPTKDGSTYYQITLVDPEDPYGDAVTRGVFRKNLGGKMEFVTSVAKSVQMMLDERLLKGEIFTATVPEYTFEGRDGKSVTTTSYTSCIMGKETIEEILLAAKHTDSEDASVSESTKKALLGIVDKPAPAPIADVQEPVAAGADELNLPM